MCQQVATPAGLSLGQKSGLNRNVILLDRGQPQGKGSCVPKQLQQSLDTPTLLTWDPVTDLGCCQHGGTQGSSKPQPAPPPGCPACHRGRDSSQLSPGLPDVAKMRVRSLEPGSTCFPPRRACAWSASPHSFWWPLLSPHSQASSRPRGPSTLAWSEVDKGSTVSRAHQTEKLAKPPTTPESRMREVELERWCPGSGAQLGWGGH